MKHFIKTILSSLIISLIALLIVSCGNTESQTVKWLDKKEGIKEWEKTIENGITKITHYYESGMKLKEESYKGPERHGKSYQWFENGLMEFDKEFDHGIKVGHHKRYYNNGALSVEQFYDKGFKTGIWKFYLINGEQWRLESYNDGSLASAKRLYTFSLK